MIEVVTSRNALLNQDALQDMFHLRHRIFVERMGWEDLRKPDRLEKDQFDTDDAIYLLLTEDDGKVIGTHRILQTAKPHLFSDLFAKYCAVKGVQRGEKIVELTRTCVDEDALDKANDHPAPHVFKSGHHYKEGDAVWFRGVEFKALVEMDGDQVPSLWAPTGKVA